MKSEMLQQVRVGSANKADFMPQEISQKPKG